MEKSFWLFGILIAVVAVVEIVFFVSWYRCFKKLKASKEEDFSEIGPDGTPMESSLEAWEYWLKTAKQSEIVEKYNTIYELRRYNQKMHNVLCLLDRARFDLERVYLSDEFLEQHPGEYEKVNKANYNWYGLQNKSEKLLEKPIYILNEKNNQVLGIKLTEGLILTLPVNAYFNGKDYIKMAAENSLIPLKENDLAFIEAGYEKLQEALAKINCPLDKDGLYWSGISLRENAYSAYDLRSRTRNLGAKNAYFIAKL